jgi:hypothetical protein
VQKLLTRLIPVGLLDTAGRGSRLASCLGGELLARGLATRRLAWMVVRILLKSRDASSSEELRWRRDVCDRAMTRPRAPTKRQRPQQREESDASDGNNCKGDSRAVCLVRAIVIDGFDDDLGEGCGRSNLVGSGCKWKGGNGAGGGYLWAARARRGSLACCLGAVI